VSGHHEEQHVASFLAEAIGCAVTDVSGLRRLGGGESAQTWGFSATLAGAGLQRFVARWYVPGEASSAFGQLLRECEAPAAAASNGVMVPQGLGMRKANLQGSRVELLLTRKVEGRTPSPWDRRDRAEVQGLRANEPLRRQFVAQLVRIHQTPVPRAIREADRAIGGSMVQRELERCHADLAASGFDDDPVLAYAVAWVEARLREHPVEDEGLVHGDYRLGNMILDAGGIAAVIDWESAQGGNGLYDLAWLVSPVGCVDGLASGLFERAELVHMYEECRGRTVGPELRTLAVLAMLRNFSSWISLARVNDAATWSKKGLRQLVSALRVRADCLQPIFGGSEFFRAPLQLPPPSSLLGQVTDRLRAEARSRETADPALDGALMLLRNLGRGTASAGPFELASHTASYLDGIGATAYRSGVPLDIALCEHLRTVASKPSCDAEVQSLLQAWSSAEAGWLLTSPRRGAQL